MQSSNFDSQTVNRGEGDKDRSSWYHGFLFTKKSSLQNLENVDSFITFTKIKKILPEKWTTREIAEGAIQFQLFLLCKKNVTNVVQMQHN